MFYPNKKKGSVSFSISDHNTVLRAVPCALFSFTQQTMGVDILEFCTPPIPGQQHKYYGNAHNNFIKLPITIPPHTKIQKTPINNSLHSIATLGDLNLLKQILPLLRTPQKAVNEPHHSTGLTPLHFAASRGHLTTVQCLVDDYSASIDVKDREGEVIIIMITK